MKIKDVNKLDKKLMRRFQKIDGFGMPTFAEVSFMLPRFIEDEKGNVYISGMVISLGQIIGYQIRNTMPRRACFYSCLIRGTIRRREL